jgi:mediator of RNA polymerase II transcription subunit 12, fungi type
MPIFPHIQAAIQENSLEQPDDLATTLWYRNRTHGDWGTVSWQAIISSIEMRTWNIFVMDVEMAHRFATLVRNVDNHLPDGIEEVVKTWFETTGAEKMIHASDELWEMVKELCLRLVLGGVISPATVLKGLIYPAWISAQAQPSDGLLPGRIGRSLALMNTMTRCLPASFSGDSASSIEIQLQMETCRARCCHPSNLLEIIDGISTLSVLETDAELEPAIRQLLKQFRRDLLEDQFVREEVLSRTRLLEDAFKRTAKKYPTHEKTLIANLRGCIGMSCTRDLEIGKGSYLSTY